MRVGAFSPRDEAGAGHQRSTMSAGTLDAIAPPRDARLLLAGAQGTFYVVTGIWPLVSMRTFEAVTGPKTDKWLVKTVGLLLTVIGGTLVLSARRRRLPPEVAWLGGATAGALGSVSGYYVLRGRVSRIYLADAASELGLAASWAILGARRRRAATG